MRNEVVRKEIASSINYRLRAAALMVVAAALNCFALAIIYTSSECLFTTMNSQGEFSNCLWMAK